MEDNKKKEKDRSLKEDQIAPDLYEKAKIPFFKTILLAFILLVLGFAANFSFQNIIKSSIDMALGQLRSCPITYTDISTSLLLPSITVSGVNISGQCLGAENGSLALEQVEFKFAAPSLYPLGLRLHGQIVKGDSVINIYPTISVFSHIIKVEDTIISSDLIKELLGRNAFSGKIELNLLATIQNLDLKDAKLQIKSTDFAIEPQNIKGFDLPRLSIGNISIKGEYQLTRFDLNEFIFGNQNSPLIAEMKGKIRINKASIAFSKLELEGDISFAKSFMDSFPILNLFLSGKQANNGFYKVKLEGTFANPSPSVL